MRFQKGEITHVLWNARAGIPQRRKFVVRTLRAYLEQVRSKGSVYWWETRSPKEVRECLQAMCTVGRGIVLVVGGDGTLSSLARYVDWLPGPVVPVPSGSGNGIAHTLGIYTVADAIRCLVQGTFVGWRLFYVEGWGWALNFLGVGLTGWIAWLFARTRNRGLAGYLKGFALALNYPSRRFRLRVDGEHLEEEEEVHLWDCTVGVGREWGNGVVFHPGQNPLKEDVRLVVGWLRRPPVHRWLCEGWWFLRRQHIHGSRYWRFQFVRRVDLLAGPRHAHIDGEPIVMRYPCGVWVTDRVMPFLACPEKGGGRKVGL